MQVTHNNLPDAVAALLSHVEALQDTVRRLENSISFSKSKGEKLVGIKAISKYYKLAPETVMGIIADKNAPIYKTSTSGRPANFCYTNEMDEYFRTKKRR
jgi:hypothetical protein